MIRTPGLLILFFTCYGFAQNTGLTVTSAASTSNTVTAGSLATATGTNLASGTATASTVPWPTSLGGITVQVVDSGNVSHPAGLLFVSQGQVNFQIPADTALGIASVFVKNGDTTLTGTAMIAAAAPALFAIDASGIAAATAVRLTIPTQIQSPVTVFTCGAMQAGVQSAVVCNLAPIDPGLDAPVYLSFYGTGIGNGPATVNFGSTAVNATYAGPQGQFPGLDQVNVGLPLSLRGAGDVQVTVTVNGVTSNAVKIRVQ
jgi:uncharacterized protein (TIGR03437 family)